MRSRYIRNRVMKEILNNTDNSRTKLLMNGKKVNKILKINKYKCTDVIIGVLIHIDTYCITQINKAFRLFHEYETRTQFEF